MPDTLWTGTASPWCLEQKGMQVDVEVSNQIYESVFFLAFHLWSCGAVKCCNTKPQPRPHVGVAHSTPSIRKSGSCPAPVATYSSPLNLSMQQGQQAVTVEIIREQPTRVTNVQHSSSSASGLFGIICGIISIIAIAILGCWCALPCVVIGTVLGNRVSTIKWVLVGGEVFRETTSNRSGGPEKLFPCAFMSGRGTAVFTACPKLASYPGLSLFSPFIIHRLRSFIHLEIMLQPKAMADSPSPASWLAG